MNRTEIERKTNEFLIQDFEINPEKISPKARLKEDVGIDSLDFVDIAVFVEKIFGVKLGAEQKAVLVTLSDLYDYIEGRLNS